MKCRKCYKEPGSNKYKISWFGSVGAKFPERICFSDDVGIWLDYRLEGDTYKLHIENVNDKDKYIKDNGLCESFKCEENKEIIVKSPALVNKIMFFPTANINNFGTSQQFYTLTTPYSRSISFMIPKIAIKPDTTNNDYSDKQNAIRDTLIQRLSVIKGELWYSINYGLPLLDRVRNKGIFDAVILDIITQVRGVKNVTKFNSRLNNHEYTLDIEILTIYNETVSITTSM